MTAFSRLTWNLAGRHALTNHVVNRSRNTHPSTANTYRFHPSPQPQYEQQQTEHYFNYQLQTFSTGAMGAFTTYHGMVAARYHISSTSPSHLPSSSLFPTDVLLQQHRSLAVPQRTLVANPAHYYFSLT